MTKLGLFRRYSCCVLKECCHRRLDLDTVQTGHERSSVHTREVRQLSGVGGGGGEGGEAAQALKANFT